MALKTVIAAIFLFLVINSYSQDNSERMDNFFELIGKEKAEVLKETVANFNQFLNENFNSYDKKEDKVYQFLLQLQQNNSMPNDDWKYNLDKNRKLIEKFESTGLRKEIWIYGKEAFERDSFVLNYYENYKNKDTTEYQSLGELMDIDIDIEQDRNYNLDSILKADSIRFLTKTIASSYSLLIVGMDMYQSNDTSIQNYSNAKLDFGDITPNLLINGLLRFDKQSYLDPYCDIILITEIFYYFMRSNQGG